MKAISNDKRELLIVAKQRNETEESIAKWLGISKSAVAKIWKRFQEKGNFLPTRNIGRKSSISLEKIDEIHSLIKKSPDATLTEIIENLSLPIRKSQLSRLLISLGYSYKKNYLPCGAISAKRSRKA
jgi:transposase